MDFKTIRNDKKSLKKALYLPFCIFSIISIQYELINLLFYTEMDDKNDIKGEFSILYRFFIVSTIFSVSF